ncbi:MAG: hypothetical protein L3J66_10255 [Bacteroidales bacterium]|nr:hypothetical protein [Bacteroidales bacterium]
MQKRTNKIQLLFIWLTGLMFFAHGITPHHHHFDSVFGHHQQENHTDEPPENIPAHCHAFNDLVIVTTGVSISNISISYNFSAFILESDLQLSLAENSFSGIPISHREQHPPEKVFLKNSPTRGSPFQA